MEYRATFKSMAGLTIMLLLMAVISIGAGVSGHAPGMILIGLLLVTFLVTIRIRFKVVLTDSEIISTGFFSTKRIAIDEITNGHWLVDDGYPRDRLYGPDVYEIQTSKDSLRINFKLFPLECMQTVLELTERT